MRYKAHLFGGFCAYACAWYVVFVFGYQLTLLQSFAGLTSCLLGAIFPDVDTKSVMQRLFFKALFLCSIALLIYSKNIIWFFGAAIIGIVPLMVRHRGLFHRWWFLLVLSILLASSAYFVPITYKFTLLWCAGSFALGSLSHLVLDNI